MSLHVITSLDHALQLRMSEFPLLSKSRVSPFSSTGQNVNLGSALTCFNVRHILLWFCWGMFFRLQLCPDPQASETILPQRSQKKGSGAQDAWLWAAHLMRKHGALNHGWLLCVVDFELVILKCDATRKYIMLHICGIAGCGLHWTSWKPWAIAMSQFSVQFVEVMMLSAFQFASQRAHLQNLFWHQGATYLLASDRKRPYPVIAVIATLGRFGHLLLHLVTSCYRCQVWLQPWSRYVSWWHLQSHLGPPLPIAVGSCKTKQQSTTDLPPSSSLPLHVNVSKCLHWPRSCLLFCLRLSVELIV